VVAVTGLDPLARAAIDTAARDIAVLAAANTSLGVAVMKRIAGLAAAALPAFEIEITEAHHRMKRDAPSGTALKLGDAIAAARGRTLGDIAVYERHGNSAPRRPEQVGFSVIRAGDIVGTHTVLYAGADETLEITHRATDRSCFARGALAAANWLAGRPPGLYRMEDVLGF
jgi:4-hydroxy-tetrahydrodipicolinate reductase